MKPMDGDKSFNRRVIISKLEASLNDDDEIDASGITEVQIETVVVAEVVQWVKCVNNLKLLLFLKNDLKNQVCILKQSLNMLEQWMNP